MLRKLPSLTKEEDVFEEFICPSETLRARVSQIALERFAESRIQFHLNGELNDLFTAYCLSIVNEERGFRESQNKMTALSLVFTGQNS